jgi:uncharacterized protein
LIEFSKKEIEFLETLEEARIATSHNNIPHVKPVSFVYHKGGIIVATDYDTRTFTNIKINSNTAITIDVYQSGNHKAVCIQGKSEIIEKGPEFKKFYDIFYKKFQWVRNDPWKENEAPFLKIITDNKLSWGLK